MKKALPAITTLLSTLLTTVLVGTLLVDISLADPFVVPPSSAVVKIQLPENKVYIENSISAAFTIELVQYGENGFTCNCFLDDRQIKTQASGGPYVYSCTASLSRLSEGIHSLKVSVSGNYYAHISSGGYNVPFGGGAEVFFTVNAAEPSVRVLSPISAKTYNTITLPLEFTVSEPTSWLGYSIDGKAPITLIENTTLSGLSDGTHTIVVQAEDTAGSTGVSTPITFYVETQKTAQPTEIQPSPLPTTFTATVIIASAAIVAFGLVAYFLRRKSKRSAT